MGSEDDCENTAPVLVAYDDHLGTIWALGVATKEISKTIIDHVVRKLDVSGYRGAQVSLNSDEEPAIVAIKKAIAAARVGHSPRFGCPCARIRGRRRRRTCRANLAGQVSNPETFLRNAVD